MFTIFTHLFIGFFFINNAYALPVSFLTVFKEFSMEFFQFLKRNAGSRGDNVSLGFGDLMYFFT